MGETIATLDQHLGTAAKLHRVLREGGLLEEALQWPIDDPEFRSGLIAYWNTRGRSIEPVEETESQQRARAIMGKGFLGLNDAQQHFGIVFDDDQLQKLAEIPFDEATLQACRDTHSLFPGFPLSVLDIRQRSRRRGEKLFYSDKDAWYNGEEFARDEKVGLRWYLVRKDIIKDSTSKTFQEQTTLLPDTEETPRACELVYMIMLTYLAKGVRLFEKIYARCVDRSSGGSRVYVGFFDSDGLDVSSWTDGYRDGSIGLAASRKLNLES